MKRNLPPFASLRAFEAATRLESFKAAASELGLTQSAISHHVRSLEDHLGFRLFDRPGNGVVATSAGKAYYRDIRSALDFLSEATCRARGETLEGVVSVSATPAFTSRWLAPRMDRFARRYPEISLKINQNDQPLAFPDDDSDMMIQYGCSAEAGFVTDPFLSTTRFPVCSPDFLKREGRPERPGDLAGMTLLKDEYGDGWAEWFEAAEERPPERANGPLMAHCELSLRAAKEGQGLALAYGALIEKELRSGELIRLFDVETPRRIIYSMMYPEAYANRPRIAAFRNWVLEEAGAGRA